MTAQSQPLSRPHPGRGESGTLKSQRHLPAVRGSPHATVLTTTWLHTYALPEVSFSSRLSLGAPHISSHVGAPITASDLLYGSTLGAFHVQPTMSSRCRPTRGYDRGYDRGSNRGRICGRIHGSTHGRRNRHNRDSIHGPLCGQLRGCSH